MKPIVIWNTLKSYLRGSFITEGSRLKKEKLQIQLEDKIRKLQEEQKKPGSNKILREMTKTRAELEALDINLKIATNYLKRNYNENGNKKSKLLSNVIKRKAIKNNCQNKN